MKLVESILTKNPCYTAGRTITVKGLMLHSVGCSQPSALAFIKNWNSPSFERACVHGFIDGNDGTVYQTLPWNHRGWHSGSSINGCGINFTFDEMPEFKAIKEKFEKDYDCLVYYGVLTTTTIGQFLSLLFVSRYEEEWEDDRRELKEGYPYAYVWNREEEFGEIGSIQIKMEQGGLVRVA